MATITLVSDTSDQQNWGCQATSAALKALLAETFPGSQLLSIPIADLRKEFRVMRAPGVRGKIYESNSGNKSVTGSAIAGGQLAASFKRKMSRPAEFFPIVADEFEDVAARWLRGDCGPVAADFIEKARRSDYVVFNGEGGVYGRVKKGTRPLFMMYFARKHLNKPSFIVNHTAHFDTSTPFLLSMARVTYPLMDGVTVREPVSQRQLRELGVYADAEVSPDALFSRVMTPTGTLAKSFPEMGKLKRYVCVGASSLVSDSKPWQPIEGFEKLVRGLQQEDYQVVLVAKDRDDSFLEKVARRCDATFFGPQYSFEEFYELLRGARLFITGRYHPIILSAMAGCPFIPMNGNTHKMEGVCELLEHPYCEPFDLLNLRTESEKILKAGLELLEQYDAQSERLLARVAVLAEQARRNTTIMLDGVHPTSLANAQASSTPPVHSSSPVPVGAGR